MLLLILTAVDPAFSSFVDAVEVQQQEEVATDVKQDEEEEEEEASTTPVLLNKFASLSNEWQTKSSTETSTPKLVHKLDSLQTQWKTTSSQKQQKQEQQQQRDWDEESSLGRTTLSSYEGATLANTPRNDTAFERLYRNDRRYTSHRNRRKNSPPPLDDDQPYGSPANSSVSDSPNTAGLEKRLAYVPPGEVRRVRQQQRQQQQQNYANSSVCTPVSAKTDSVFERLYRREPRPKSDAYRLYGGATPNNSAVNTPSRSVKSAQISRQRHSIASTPARSVQSQRRTSLGPSSASSVTDSVFERLYRNTPRPSPVRKSKQRNRLTAPSLPSAGSVSSAQTDSVFERLHQSRPSKLPTPGSTSSTTGSMRSKNNSSARKQQQQQQQLQPQTPNETSVDQKTTPQRRISQIPAPKTTRGVKKGSLSIDTDKFAPTNIKDSPGTVLLTASSSIGSGSNFSITTPTSATTHTTTQQQQQQRMRNAAAEPKVRKTPHRVFTEIEKADAVVLIQSVWRMTRLQRQYHSAKIAVTALQACQRMRIQRFVFQKQRSTMKLYSALDRAEATDQARKNWQQQQRMEEIALNITK